MINIDALASSLELGIQARVSALTPDSSAVLDKAKSKPQSSSRIADLTVEELVEYINTRCDTPQKLEIVMKYLTDSQKQALEKLNSAVEDIVEEDRLANELFDSEIMAEEEAWERYAETEENAVLHSDYDSMETFEADTEDFDTDCDDIAQDMGVVAYSDEFEDDEDFITDDEGLVSDDSDLEFDDEDLITDDEDPISDDSEFEADDEAFDSVDEVDFDDDEVFEDDEVFDDEDVLAENIAADDEEEVFDDEEEVLDDEEEVLDDASPDMGITPLLAGALDVESSSSTDAFEDAFDDESFEASEVFEDDEESFDDDEELFEDDEDTFENDEESFGDDEKSLGVVEDSFDNDEELFDDDEESFEDDEESFDDIDVSFDSEEEVYEDDEESFTDLDELVSPTNINTPVGVASSSNSDTGYSCVSTTSPMGAKNAVCSKDPSMQGILSGNTLQSGDNFSPLPAEDERMECKSSTAEVTTSGTQVRSSSSMAVVPAQASGIRGLSVQDSKQVASVSGTLVPPQTGRRVSRNRPVVSGPKVGQPTLPSRGTQGSVAQITSEQPKSTSKVGEVYCEGWDLLTYLKNNKDNKEAKHIDVVKLYYSEAVIRKYEAADRIIISKGYLRK